MLPEQTRAILWAQWRSFMNRSPALRRSFPLTAIVMTLWYALWTLGAISAAIVCADEDAVPLLRRALAPLLIAATLYWQMMPVFMATAGASLDLRRLIVYPIPRSQLFRIEVALRATTAIEMLIMVTGASLGLLLNPALPKWSPLGFVPFVLFNLLLSSAIRDLLTRLMARKVVREIAVLAVVLLSVLPQLVLRKVESMPQAAEWVRYAIAFPWPWVATANFALAGEVATSAVALLVWAAAAWYLALRQFELSLRESAAEVRAAQRKPVRQGLAEGLFRLPSRLFPDPLGAMIEKEVRSLARSPRFRLVFIMGFTFGLVIWLPIGLSGGESNWISEHYLTVAIAYEVLLLGEVVIWNIFGFDRRAAQAWFALPVPLTTVFVAKNLSAAFFIALNAVLIMVICTAFGLRMSLSLIGEAVSVTAVLSLLLLGIGNMLSVRNARPVDPDQSWGRSSAGRVQMVLLLVYPLLAIPLSLAFLARDAFETELAFYGVIAFDLVVAAIVYWIAMESAVQTARERREEMLGKLSREAGVLSS